MTPEQFVCWLSGYLTASGKLGYENTTIRDDIIQTLSHVKFNNHVFVTTGTIEV